MLFLGRRERIREVGALADTEYVFRKIVGDRRERRTHGNDARRLLNCGGEKGVGGSNVQLRKQFWNGKRSG